MKTRTKITVTLAVGIGLLIGSMGVASASPHYSDFKGGTSFKAPVSSYSHNLEWDLKAPVDSGRTSGFRGCIPTDPDHKDWLNGCIQAPVEPSAFVKLGDIQAPVDSGRTSGFRGCIPTDPCSSYTEVEWTLKASVRGNNRGEWKIKETVSSYREDGAGRCLGWSGHGCSI